MTGFVLRAPWYARERLKASVLDSSALRPAIQMYDGTDFVKRLLRDPRDSLAVTKDDYWSYPVPVSPTFQAAQAGRLRLATHLHREACVRHPQWRVMCQRLMDLLLGYIERWASAEAPTGVVDRLKSLLVTGAHDPEFGVGDALRALPCSADHARRLFARATGITPVDYLGSLRLDAAKRHLLGGAGVAEAADRSGFADPYYFSRVFARSEGMPPSRWAAQRRAS